MQNTDTTGQPPPTGKTDGVSVNTTENEAIPPSLSHVDLINGGNRILGKTYDVTLYLEQQPTAGEAEFISQPDDSRETILVTCKMPAQDIDKLDGVSAQKGIFKPYKLNVVFNSFTDQYGGYYKGDCSLRK